MSSEEAVAIFSPLSQFPFRVPGSPPLIFLGFSPPLPLTRLCLDSYTEVALGRDVVLLCSC